MKYHYKRAALESIGFYLLLTGAGWAFWAVALYDWHNVVLAILVLMFTLSVAMQQFVHAVVRLFFWRKDRYLLRKLDPATNSGMIHPLKKNLDLSYDDE